MFLNMMTPASTEAGLARRLTRLKGVDPLVCVPQYVSESSDIARSPRFARTLAQARALADEHRLVAVAMLRRRSQLCACEIQAALGVTHATVSHHMRILEAAGIVSETRQGKWTYYRLKDDGGIRIP